MRDAGSFSAAVGTQLMPLLRTTAACYLSMHWVSQAPPKDSPSPCNRRPCVSACRFCANTDFLVLEMPLVPLQSPRFRLLLRSEGSQPESQYVCCHRCLAQGREDRPDHQHASPCSESIWPGSHNPTRKACRRFDMNSNASIWSVRVASTPYE